MADCEPLGLCNPESLISDNELYDLGLSDEQSSNGDTIRMSSLKF